MFELNNEQRKCFGLRNPKFRADLEQVCRHFDVEPSQLIPFDTL